MLGRFLFWRLRRRLTHPHAEFATGAFAHSHQYPDLDHGHELDQACRRSECERFRLHRVHPRPVA